MPFYSEKAISEIVRLSFFSQLFLWNFLNFFGHIFLHAFSQWLFKYVRDQSYVFHPLSSYQVPFYSEKAISEIVRLSFFSQLFFEFFEFFWSYFSSCLFTVIIQVCSRPIICFSSLSSYQVPFYSEKAISEIVRLSFFSQLFLWNFLNFFGHIFLHAFSQWLFKYVRDQSYVFHPLSSYQVPFYSEKAISEIVRLSFFSQLFFWNFLNFLVIFFFMPFHSDYSSMFRPIIDQSYTAKKRFFSLWN